MKNKFKDTPKRKLARRRNWTKARILGLMSLDFATITSEEKGKLEKIHKIQQSIIDSWDDNSKKLGLLSKTKKDGR